MASPQLEHGYTRIANPILFALAINSLAQIDYRIILWLLRLTYGWQRKSVITNIGAFSSKLGLSKDVVRESFCRLEANKILICEWATVDLVNVSFNKDYEAWKRS